MKSIKICLIALLMAGPALVNPFPISADMSVEKRSPMSVSLYDQCTGEMVQVTGEYHRITSTKMKANGTRQIRTQFHTHGEGVGMTSGNRYVFNDKFTQTSEDAPVCGYRSVIIRDQKLISQGAYPDRTLKITLTIDEDANCAISTSTTESLECRD
jgi:hypothetical protein